MYVGAKGWGKPVNFGAMLDSARELWSLADTWVGMQNSRNDEMTIAAKEWKGPHFDSFLNHVKVDYADEYSLENDLRTAATAMAQAWVDAMNAENQKRYDQAVDDANTPWDFLPGVSDGDVSELSIITVAPSPPDFTATGTFYQNTAS